MSHCLSILRSDGESHAYDLHTHCKRRLSFTRIGQNIGLNIGQNQSRCHVLCAQADADAQRPGDPPLLPPHVSSMHAETSIMCVHAAWCFGMAGRAVQLALAAEGNQLSVIEGPQPNIVLQVVLLHIQGVAPGHYEGLQPAPHVTHINQNPGGHIFWHPDADSCINIQVCAVGSQGHLRSVD